MEMQQLQRRFEARELADIMRSRNMSTSGRRRDKRRNARSKSLHSSDSNSSSSDSSSEGERDTDLSNCKPKDDDSDDEGQRSAIALSTRRRRERKSKENEDGQSATKNGSRCRKPDDSSVAKKPMTTPKCSLCNTYNSLRLCAKGMCSRCCPSDGTSIMPP